MRNCVEEGVLEPAMSKVKIIQVRCMCSIAVDLCVTPVSAQFATEAAITIMRIDDLIQLEPEQQEGEE